VKELKKAFFKIQEENIKVTKERNSFKEDLKMYIERTVNS